MRFVKPESLDKDSIILDVRGADEYAHERLALPHIVIKADKVDPDKFMAEYNPGGDKLVNILCTSGGVASEVAEKFEEAGYPNVAVVVGGIIEAEYEGVKNMQNINNTQYFRVEKEPELKVGDVLTIVYRALSEKGYNPVNQIVGYIMSGDPTYITSHNNARSLIMKVERDELVEEVLKTYIENSAWD